jgi:hypothetical protein
MDPQPGRLEEAAGNSRTKTSERPADNRPQDTRAVKNRITLFRQDRFKRQPVPPRIRREQSNPRADACKALHQPVSRLSEQDPLANSIEVPRDSGEHPLKVISGE